MVNLNCSPPSMALRKKLCDRFGFDHLARLIEVVIDERRGIKTKVVIN